MKMYNSNENNIWHIIVIILALLFCFLPIIRGDEINWKNSILTFILALFYYLLMICVLKMTDDFKPTKK